MNTTYYRNKELTEVIQGLGKGTIGWQADESGTPCEFLFTGTEWILMSLHIQRKAERKRANKDWLLANPNLSAEFAQKKKMKKRSGCVQAWHKSDSLYSHA